jgi:hypothetical protein
VRGAAIPCSNRGDELEAAVLRAAGVIAVRGDGRKWGDALGSEVRGHYMVGVGQGPHHGFARFCESSALWANWTGALVLRASRDCLCQPRTAVGSRAVEV